MSLVIRSFSKNDWTTVSEIYHHGLLTRNATFETEVPEYEIWRKKFHADLLWVVTANHEVIGWAGLQPVSVRNVYRGVTEVTVYIHRAHSGKGVGGMLMNHLIYESEKAGIWTLYASIFPENTASLKLHQSAGFREIGYREKIGKLDGHWRNTILFERRSKVAGL